MEFVSSALVHMVNSAGLSTISSSVVSTSMSEEGEVLDRLTASPKSWASVCSTCSTLQSKEDDLMSGGVDETSCGGSSSSDMMRAYS